MEKWKKIFFYVEKEWAVSAKVHAPPPFNGTPGQKEWAVQVI